MKKDIVEAKMIPEHVISPSIFEFAWHNVTNLHKISVPLQQFIQIILNTASRALGFHDNNESYYS